MRYLLETHSLSQPIPGRHRQRFSTGHKITPLAISPPQRFNGQGPCYSPA